MKELININTTALEVKEYKGHRVVTLKEIDEVHQRPEGTARKRFNDNKQHFVEGVDYYKVCASEIRTHKIMELSPKAHEDVALITESGYLMLVKSFTDDLAWAVQRELVNNYFRVKATLKPMTDYQKEQTRLKEENAHIRKAQILERLANQYEGTYRQILHAYATKELSGKFLLPLPELEEKTYSATEIGELLGITANRVGLLTNRYDLKTEQYGQWFKDKSRYSDKEVSSFRYFERVIPVLQDLLDREAS